MSAAAQQLQERVSGELLSALADALDRAGVDIRSDAYAGVRALLDERSRMRHVEQETLGVVLVVDDTPASRYIAGSWLRRHGHQVVEAATGAEALAVLARQAVDLVVLDVGLPDMSGFEVCERIKADASMGHPVIHLSATSVRGSDRAQGLTRGADAYLAPRGTRRPSTRQSPRSVRRRLRVTCWARRCASASAVSPIDVKNPTRSRSTTTTSGRAVTAVVSASRSRPAVIRSISPATATWWRPGRGGSPAS